MESNELKGLFRKKKTPNGLNQHRSHQLSHGGPFLFLCAESKTWLQHRCRFFAYLFTELCTTIVRQRPLSCRTKKEITNSCMCVMEKLNRRKDLLLFCTKCFLNECFFKRNYHHNKKGVLVHFSGLFSQSESPRSLKMNNTFQVEYNITIIITVNCVCTWRNKNEQTKCCIYFFFFLWLNLKLLEIFECCSLAFAAVILVGYLLD